LPKGIEAFDLVDGVLGDPSARRASVAIALRYSLIEVAAARKATEGQQGKMEMV